MRVSIVTETYPPEINGVALTVHGLAHGLAARGHAVQVVRPRQPADASDPGVATLRVRGVALPRYAGLRFGLPAGGRLRHAWRAARPDAIYVATEGPLGGSALRAASRLGIPACTGFHTRFDDYAAHYGAGLLTPLVRAHLRRFHRRAAATLVPTRALADELAALGIGNARLLHRAVDTALFHPQRRDAALRAGWGARDGSLVVLYVGRIAPEKNLDLAVRAFRTLQARVPDARYVWVGDGPARAALAAAHPDFIFAGTRHGEDLARHYASADLFLFPSLTETFGNVTLEAMASGLAVVAYDRGAAREHLADGISGMRVPAGDARGFVAAAFALGFDAALREALRRNARSAVAALTPAAAIAEFESLLAQLVRERDHGHVAFAARV
ncbi:MAG: glycosyltransferase family 1 protein [Mizugakiibacter sp.]|uniref:glycosyltransferase family 4 protein n=1 Tax=Mizugakiibacter sp. TaxID=1972610 RepID=UPI0031C02D6B|nr:glycosyltransferase family 1 protein [Xanthomonadaceae bacterium]